MQQKNIEKVSRFLEKGLDPNFHDPDTGGEELISLFPFMFLPLFVSTTKWPCMDFVK